MEAATVRGVTDVTTKPSVAIVTKIADREGVDPTAVTPPLYSVIDPEALDSLFSTTEDGNSRTAGSVHFTYNGYEVQVECDGSVSVTED